MKSRAGRPSRILRDRGPAYSVGPHFYGRGLKRKSGAGKGLSRGGSGERRAVRPISALPRHPPMTESFVGGAGAAPLSMRASALVASAIVRAARQLLTDLERSRRIDAALLRSAMEAAFGASDARGAWNWKTAYDACEAATVLFLRRYGVAMRAKAGSPAAMLPMLMRIINLFPPQTRRSDESASLPH